MVLKKIWMLIWYKNISIMHKYKMKKLWLLRRQFHLRKSHSSNKINQYFIFPFFSQCSETKFKLCETRILKSTFWYEDYNNIPLRWYMACSISLDLDQCGNHRKLTFSVNAGYSMQRLWNNWPPSQCIMQIRKLFLTIPRKKFQAVSLVYVNPANVTSVLIEFMIVVCSS
jgi:hypothetical protein